MQLVNFRRLAAQSGVSSELFGAALVVASTFTGGLAATRILYEAFFPHLLFLGRPWPVLLLAAVMSGTGLWLWRRLQREGAGPRLVLCALPLLLNVTYLFNPAVDLIRSRLFFGAGLWLMLLFWYAGDYRPRVEGSGWRELLIRHRPLLWFSAAIAIIYLLTMGRAVGRHDTFEFQVVAYQLGIAHPSGYPLYLMLGHLFTLLPFGSVAWRVNLASVLYGVLALAFVYLLVRRLSRTEWPALLAAVLLALSPTFWSQAIEAEVYTLHALFVAASLWLMVMLSTEAASFSSFSGEKWTFSVYICGLFVLLGFSLTNHLTTVFLLPAAALTWLFLTVRRRLPLTDIRLFVAWALSFLLPLSLYAYLPIRWLAVNKEPMGLARFVDWVLGRRFGGALQWSAWLEDPARYEVVGRLFTNEWPWPFLLLAFAGFAWLTVRQWQVALLLAVTWLGYVYYGLNYYVPDLAVFILPAHLITALWAGLAVTAFTGLVEKKGPALLAGFKEGNANFHFAGVLAPLVFLLLVGVVLSRAATFWPLLDRSGNDGLAQWGRSVLALPLQSGATLLADSEKIAPLYYLQKVEGIRPDMNIMVLPDEAAYRSELDRRLAAGQAVYLARFLPGLEGIYHLRSQGPLVEVSEQPLSQLPAGVESTAFDFGPIRLAGLRVETEAAVDPAATAVTFYWQSSDAQPAREALYVYVRWAGAALTGQTKSAGGRHPANNYYPTTAWRPGEVVPDFHLLPRPLLAEERLLQIEVALAPPFSRPDELQWQTVASVSVPAARPEDLDRLKPVRALVGTLSLTGAILPTQARPQPELPVVLSGYGRDVERLQLSLGKTEGLPAAGSLTLPAGAGLLPAAWSVGLAAELPPGFYQVSAAYPGAASVCHWLGSPRAACALGQVEISGVSLPEGAINFEDKIALLAVDLTETSFAPGGRLAVNLTWQALAPIDDNYTVFVQVVDAGDRIVGQVDAWPLHGTYPTGQWRPGEVVNDPYQVQLLSELPPGPYRLLVGWYLLASLRRLPVVDADGIALDDKVIIPGLTLR
jgi:4-amino-4-deoxy-L-arabinose transferase-like glycosyltransferase